MTKSIYILILSAAILSCSSSEEKNNSNLTNSSESNISEAKKEEKGEFEQLCMKLPFVQIPFEIYCEECCNHPTLGSEQSDIHKYLPDGSSFIGVIEIEEKYISLLISYPADWTIPSVVTFNLYGNLIDEEVFLGGYCGNDYEYLGKQYFQIINFKELLEIDTSYHFEYNEANYEIKDTIDIEIKNKPFKIEKTGEIVAL